MTFPFRLIYSQEPQGRVIPGGEWDSSTQLRKIYIHQSGVFPRICLCKGERSITTALLLFKHHFPAGPRCRWCKLCQTELLSQKMRGEMCWDSPCEASLQRIHPPIPLLAAPSSCCLPGMHNPDFKSTASQVILWMGAPCFGPLIS